MLSLNWCDRRGGHTIVGDRAAVMAIYALLVNENRRAEKKRRAGDEAPIAAPVAAIHAYNTHNGLELDPEKGMEEIWPPVVPLRPDLVAPPGAPDVCALLTELERLRDENAALRTDAGKALARLCGAAGGKARAAKLTPERRSEIARKAVETRWAKHRGC